MSADSPAENNIFWTAIGQKEMKSENLIMYDWPGCWAIVSAGLWESPRVGSKVTLSCGATYHDFT
eukprot:scaffold11783_cov45-Prasinocladus_malaysianus.AAC.1